MGSALYAKMFKQTLKYDESKEQDNPNFFKKNEDYMADRKAIDPFQKEFNALQKVNKTKTVDLNDPEQYRGEYNEYVNRKTKGYTQDNSADGMPNQKIPADPNNIMTYNRFFKTKEIARGGKRAVKALKELK
tara:strand:- start:536 stop:931 length:396 start_codon:yes stop_codon:yes gene_type:complete